MVIRLTCFCVEFLHFAFSKNRSHAYFDADAAPHLHPVWTQTLTRMESEGRCIRCKLGVKFARPCYVPRHCTTWYLIDWTLNDVSLKLTLPTTPMLFTINFSSLWGPGKLDGMQPKAPGGEIKVEIILFFCTSQFSTIIMKDTLLISTTDNYSYIAVIFNVIEGQVRNN